MRIENEIFLLEMINALNTYEDKVNTVKKMTSNKEIIKAAAIFYSKDADKVISENPRVLLDSNTHNRYFEDLVNIVNELFERYFKIYYQR